MGYWISATLRAGLCLPILSLRAWQSWLAKNEDKIREILPPDGEYDEYESVDLEELGLHGEDNVAQELESLIEEDLLRCFNHEGDELTKLVEWKIESHHYDDESIKMDQFFLVVHLPRRAGVSVDAGSPSSKSWSWNIATLPFSVLDDLRPSPSELELLHRLRDGLLIPHDPDEKHEKGGEFLLPLDLRSRPPKKDQFAPGLINILHNC